MITSVEQMIEQYVSAWNENNYDTYLREFEKCWAPTGTYTDPTSENLTGPAGMAAFAYKSLEIVPIRKFNIIEAPVYHHNAGKYTWSVELPGASNTGFDYFEYNEEFKITRLVSFFQLPADYPVEKLK